MQTRDAHYVTFFSPGTFVSETTTHPIHAWDRELAVQMSKSVVERYGATPYAFMFETYLEACDVVQTDRGSLRVEPRRTARSGMHFLGGTVLTLADVEARNDPSDRILISNMQNSDFDRVIEGANGFQWCQPFRAEDCVVDEKGQVVGITPRTGSSSAPGSCSRRA